MNPTTETALRASIAHWEDVVRDPVNANVGRSACALCMMFNNPHEDKPRTRADDCKGCPVSDMTGEKWCDGSPYYDFENAADEDDIIGMRSAAVAELEFLKSLLPETAK